MVSIRRRNIHVECADKAELISVLQQELQGLPTDKKLYAEVIIEVREA